MAQQPMPQQPVPQRRPQHPAAYAPFGASLYEGLVERGDIDDSADLAPYMDWGAHAHTTGRGDLTVPGRGGFDFPGEDTWGEAQFQLEREWLLGQAAGAAPSRPNYTGRGPKGYRRSDERITEELFEALTWDPYLDATDIDVRVENGEVTLSGRVDDRASRRRAADIAEEVPGVLDVFNDLRVRAAAHA